MTRRAIKGAPAADRAAKQLESSPAAVGKPDRPPTAYEARVYKLCKAIPRGKVTTYGEMAKALTSSARAVGQAMRRNPYAPVVPCHRVVASSLDLGGFKGSWVSDDGTACAGSCSRAPAVPTCCRRRRCWSRRAWRSMIPRWLLPSLLSQLMNCRSCRPSRPASEQQI